MIFRPSRGELIAAAAAGLLIAFSPSAWACSVGIEPRLHRFLETVAEAKIIVRGRIVEKRSFNLTAGPSNTYIDIEVSEILRGSVPRRLLRVWSGSPGNPCAGSDRLSSVSAETEGVFAFNAWPSPRWLTDDGHPTPFFLLENWGEFAAGRRRLRLRALRYGRDCPYGCAETEFMSYETLRTAIRQEFPRRPKP